jgi:hypothetical protein
MEPTDLDEQAIRLAFEEWTKTRQGWEPLSPWDAWQSAWRAASPPLPAPAPEDARDAARWRKILADDLALRALTGGYDRDLFTRLVDENIAKRAAIDSAMSGEKG